MRLTAPFMAALVLGLSAEGTANADGTKQACVAASTEGQALQDANKLREARDRFVACARDECPSIVRKYCAEWLAAADRRIPSVIFRAVTAGGVDVVDAQLSIDGALQHQSLGTAMTLNPGEHTVHVEREGGSPIDEKIVVAEGEKGRVVLLHFPEAPPPPPATTVASEPAEHDGTRLTPLTLIAGGVGVVGVAGFAYFGLEAQSDLSHLRQTCAPFCASSDLSTVKHEALIADVSLGVGIVALGVAAYSFFALHGAPPKDEARLDVQPVPGGALAQIGGRF
jgi:hypothetical protein